MKKRILALIMALCMLLLASCGKKKQADGDTDSLGNETSNDTEQLSNRVVTEYKGIYEERYDFIFDDICTIADTFTVDRMSEISVSDDIERMKITPDYDFSETLPAIYRYITDLSLTRDEVENYYNLAFESLANDHVPTAEQYDALFSGDADKVMKACVHETALYKDGHVYSLSMLLEGTANGVSDKEIKQVCDRAAAYYGDEFFTSPLLTDTMAEKLASLGYETISDAEKNKKTLCSVHGDEYHTYPEALIGLVGKAEFEKWKSEAASKSGDADCGHGEENIYSLIHSLGVTKDDFITLYNTDVGMIGDYPIDLLFDGTAADADSYYRASTAETRAEIGSRKTLADLKQYIIDTKGLGDFYENVMECSLAELLLVCDYTDADFEDYNRFLDEAEYSYDIDFAALLASKSEITRMIGSHSAHFVDCYVTGKPMFETPYESQLAD
ncbi:MAG: hypothetical protein ACI4QZ_05765 [Eubacteriales bacterium]